ncbi:hypothetical protein DFH09DRAFT_1275690 [Mycena vulgaris]|nr:hypothetical protein DFH09DRAFT_1275690 [Mycena vulgaris]
MHDSLRVQSFSTLRSSLKKLCTFVRTIPLEQTKLLLPIFYLHLDPSPIPAPAALETLMATGTRLPCIDIAIMSLNALGWLATLEVIPVDAAPDVWSRVSKWVLFLHTYWDYLPGVHAADAIDACINHSRIILMLVNHLATAALIFEARGIRSIVARAWMARLDEPHAKDHLLSLLLMFLADGMDDVGNFQEIIDGVGGSLDDMVIPLIKHTSRAVGAPKSDFAVASIQAIMMCLGSRDQAFHSILLSRGIVPLIVSSLSALDGSKNELTYQIVAMCLARLIRYLKRPSGNAWIAAALEAGVLRYIITFAIRAVGTTDSTIEALQPYLMELVCEILPGSLVSYAVVARAERAFSDVEHLSRASEFMHSPLYEDWGKVATLAKERAAVLDTWEAIGRESRRACDNVKCGRILMKREFKCCSTCESASYCSHECQAVDWRDAHRDVCQSLGFVRRRYHHLCLPTRERAFMRRVLDMDYQRLSYTISILIISFLVQNPAQKFYVCFDYARADGALVQVVPKSQSSVTQEFEAELPTQWGRLMRAGGRMRMDVMLVNDSGISRPLLFPMRATSSKFHDGLRRIAREVPPGKKIMLAEPVPPDVVQKVLRLLRDVDKDEMYMEIHN